MFMYFRLDHMEYREIRLRTEQIPTVFRTQNVTFCRHVCSCAIFVRNQGIKTGQQASAGSRDSQKYNFSGFPEALKRLHSQAFNPFY